MSKGSVFLNQYEAIYEKLIATLAVPYSINDTEKALHIINLLSNFAWLFHPGRFSDIRLEKWALRIGEKIWHTNKSLHTDKQSSGNSRKKILHVASATYDVGGHTRFLLNLIKGDSESLHNLVIIRQNGENIPTWLRDAILLSGGNVTSLNTLTYTEQVATLQSILCSNYDKIFYHIHPDDSVAVAALAAVPRPQVMTINHADHVFWLGSALSDVTVCFRNWALEFSRKFRNSNKCALLPIPLNFPSSELGDKMKARRVLNIMDDTIIILSVASAYKFIPSGQYNYYRVISKILAANSNVSVKIVGISNSSDLTKLGFEPHDRIELLGEIDDPSIYYKAADIYLDSMPFSSFTSLFEAMYFRCFPILQFNPVDTLRLDAEPVFSDLFSHTNDETGQLLLLQQAITDKNYRIEMAEKSSNSIVRNYMSEGWKKYLDVLYEMSGDDVKAARNLSSIQDAPSSTNDYSIEGAALSNSFNNPGSETLLRKLGEVIKFIDFTDLFNIIIFLSKEPSLKLWKLSVRQIGWLIRKKTTV